MPYKDPQKQKEYWKRYYQCHREQYRSHTKRYRSTDPQQTKNYRKKHYWKHKENILARKKTWRSTHMDHIREYDRKHPEYSRMRRARRRSVDEHYGPADEAYTRQLFGVVCFNCGSSTNLQIDHVYPLSKGYALSRANACVLCRTCNSTKGIKMPSEFFSLDKLQELKRLLFPQQLLLPF